MRTFRQTVEVEVGRVVFRCAVGAHVPATYLKDRLEAGSPLVDHLNKVVVAVGCNGNTNLHTVTGF